jgi:chemotaxis protein methyltransferase CheR
VTEAEFDFLRGFLKSRSGLALAPEKRYLVESRLAPVCQKHRLPTLADLVARLRPLPDPALARAVVEAMTTNETFFFRDRVPFDLFRDVLLRRCLTRKRRRTACASGAPPPRPARSPIPWP